MRYAPSLIAAAFAGMPLWAMSDCSVQSGPRTAALVELYTSEGCSSCPPADRRLSELRPGASLVPLALHVGYWDDLGWRDPFAQSRFADRQSWLVERGGTRAVYTPQFFVNGESVRPGALQRTVARVNALPPAASIDLTARTDADHRLEIQAKADSRIAGSLLYLSVAESALSSEVAAGENRGRRLAHDHVARIWIGPLTLDRGEIEVTRLIQLQPDWDLSKLEVGAFVQESATGRVLQAVGDTGCLAPEAARS